jgi:hypothetical protein
MDGEPELPRKRIAVWAVESKLINSGGNVPRASSMSSSGAGPLLTADRFARHIANEIEIEVAIERGADCSRRADHEQRIAVRLRIHDHLGSNIAASTRPVLDDEGLTQTRGQPLSYQARGDVGRAAGGKADDQAYWPHRIGLRPSETRYGWERGSARSQM